MQILKLLKKYKCIREWTYPLRMYFIEQPTVIRIKHPDMSPYVWSDRDYRMLYGMFQILVDFVEKEYEGLEGIDSRVEMWLKDDYVSKEHIEHYHEIAMLYQWWTVERPVKQADLWNTPFTGPHRIEGGGPFDLTPEYRAWLHAEGEREEQYHQEDDDMLIRLIKIRRSLWT